MILRGKTMLRFSGALILLTPPAATVAIVAAASNAALGDFLYTVSNRDGEFRTVDPADGHTMASVEIMLNGQGVGGATGLAVNPDTGVFYALLKSSDTRVLATIDPETGVAQQIGDTGDKFSSIAFDSDGILYGITGDGADNPETLFTLSLDDATPTFVMDLSDDHDGGEALGFNPDDGLMYRASGYLVDFIFQAINLDDLSIIDVELFGDQYSEATALAYRGGGMFYLSGIAGDLFTVSVGGEVTFIADLDHRAKGLVFVPEPGGCDRDPEWLCDGDVDGDGQVNPVDSGLVQAAFGSLDDQDLCNYDVDCDGQINPVDSGIVQSLFGTCEEPRSVCP